MSAQAEAASRGAAVCRAVRRRRRRRPGRARHLAARAQGLEGRADRELDAQLAAAPETAAARALAAARRRRTTNSAASRSRPISPRRGGAGLYQRLVVAARRRPARAIGCSRPARLAGGSIVVVNRGFVPKGVRTRRRARRAARPAWSRSSASMRWPEQRGSSRRRMSRQEPLVRARSGRDGRGEELGRRCAVLRRSGGAARARRLAEGRPLKPSLPNNHLQYAVTWFGLALVILIAAVFFCASPAARRSRHNSLIIHNNRPRQRFPCETPAHHYCLPQQPQDHVRCATFPPGARPLRSASSMSRSPGLARDGGLYVPESWPRFQRRADRRACRAALCGSRLRDRAPVRRRHHSRTPISRAWRTRPTARSAIRRSRR